MDKNEIEAGSANVVKVDKLNRCVTVTKPNTAIGEPLRMYHFDNVFAEDSAQVGLLQNSSWICLYLHYIFIDLSNGNGAVGRRQAGWLICSVALSSLFCCGRSYGVA